MSGNPGTELRNTVERCFPLLMAIEQQTASQKPAPGKWSAKEIIGHLIDSASNNHQRFVRAAFTDDLVFPGYAQDDWVLLQKYNDQDWRELVHLWNYFNLVLAFVMENMDSHLLTKQRRRHNLHEIGWRKIAENEPATLEFFMNDYIGHLKHHLTQILPESS